MERFMSKVNKTETCWLWTAGCFQSGYGAFQVGSRSVGKVSTAHRYSYELHKGKIPDGKLVRHTCDNRKCVNPDHLILGTNTDNMRDKRERNTKVIKLNPDSVREIRIMRGFGFTNMQIAKMYGVGHTIVGDIILRKKWGDVI
jgi:hypothetical protein